MDEINIWELGNKINVRVNSSFLNYLNNQIEKQYKTKRAFWKQITYQIPFSTFKGRLKPSYNYYIDLEIFLESCRFLNIPLSILQKNIIAYKTRKGTTEVISPILPIKITPIFGMLLAHHIGDGTVIDPKRGRMPYFGYRQFDEFFRVGFVKKLESVFGKINYKEDYFLKSTRPYCPASLSQLFFSYYVLKKEDFLSTKARIPKKLLYSSWEHQLAFLLGMIIDEGHVDSTMIIIKLKNVPLIEDLNLLCSLLNIDSRVSYYSSELMKEYAFLNINKKGILTFWELYLKLKQQYPLVDLGYKETKINQIFELKNRKIQKTTGNRDIILDLLKKQPLTANELAKILKMTRQGIKYHLRQLKSQNLIIMIGIKGENNHIFEFNHNI